MKILHSEFLSFFIFVAVLFGSLCVQGEIALPVAILTEINWQGHWTVLDKMDRKGEKRGDEEDTERGEHRKQKQHQQQQ